MQLDQLKKTVERLVTTELLETARVNGENMDDTDIRAFTASDRGWVFYGSDGELLLHMGSNDEPMLYVTMRKEDVEATAREYGGTAFPATMGLVLQLAQINRLGLFVTFPDGKQGELIDFVFIGTHQPGYDPLSDLPF